MSCTLNKMLSVHVISVYQQCISKLQPAPPPPIISKPPGNERSLPESVVYHSVSSRSISPPAQITGKIQSENERTPSSGEGQQLKVYAVKHG